MSKQAQRVTMHAEYFRAAHPAINVKVYRIALDAEALVKEFKCDEATAERALTWAFEAQCESFWESMPECITSEVYPNMGAQVYSEGRSGGWLAVHGLPDVEHWDAVLLSKWRKVERMVREEIAYLTSSTAMLELIRANDWCKREFVPYLEVA